jgi:hypothetical protein
MQKTKLNIVAVVGFAAQVAGMIYYLGSKSQSVTDQLDVLNKSVTRIEINQAQLPELTKAVALLEAKDREIERRLTHIERKGNPNERIQ